MTWDELKEQSDTVTEEWKQKNANITQYYQNKLNDGTMSAEEASKLLQAYSYERAARIMMEEWNENVNNADTTGEIPENYSFAGGDYGASLYKTTTTGDTVFIVGFNGTSDYKGRCADSVHFSLRIQSYSLNPTNSNSYWETYFIQPDGSIEPLPPELRNQTYEITPTAYFPNNGYFGKDLTITSSYTGTLRLSQAYIDDSNFFVNGKVYGGANRFIRGYFKGQLGGVPPTLAAGTSLETLSTSMNLFGGNFGLIDIAPTDVGYTSPWDWYNDVALPEIEDLLEDAGVDPTDFDDFETHPGGYHPTPPEPVDPDPADPDVLDISGDTEPDNFDGTLDVSSSFITGYILSAGLLSQLGNILWTSPLHWEQSGDPLEDAWKNFCYRFGTTLDTGTYDISGIMDFIVSLKVFPFDFSGMSETMVSQASGLKVGAGYTDFLPDDDVYALNTYIATMQLGEATVPELYEDYRDLVDSSVVIHLPYCGSTELNAAIVSGKTLSVAYAIDFISGNCTAVVTVFGDDDSSFQAASLPGRVGFMIPVTATNQGQVAEKLMSTFFSAGSNLVSQATSILSGSSMTLPSISNHISSVSHAPMIAGQDLSSLCLSNKPTLIVTRKQYKTPDYYTDTAGRMSTKCGTIGSFSGWTKFLNPDLSGITATESEKMKILALLESGVYI